MLDSYSRNMRNAAAVWVLAFLFLSAGIWSVRLTNTWVDPVGHVDGMDEAVYEHASRSLLEGADPMTPTFLHRPLTIKPPLLFWLTAISMKLLGISLFSVRLPCLAAGALGVALLFAWPGRKSTTTGTIAAFLLLSNPQWRTFARVDQTDVLVCALILLSVWLLARDPTLQGKYSAAVFGAVCGLAVMAKSIYGLLGFLVLCAYWAVSHFVVTSLERTPFRKLLVAGGFLALVAVPWHLYQFIVRPRYFWEDYFVTSLFQWGWHQPLSQAGPFAFYGVRLWSVDPVLALALVAALPGLGLAVWKRDGRAWVNFLWLATVLASILVFEHRSSHYMLALIPAICLVAAEYGPWDGKWRMRVLAAVLVIVFGVKCMGPSTAMWALAFTEPKPSDVPSQMRAYAELDRTNPMTLLLADDSFYATTLDLPEVHYCYLDPHDLLPTLGQHYEDLGIMVLVGNYLDPARRNRYLKKLREWNVDERAFAQVLRAHTEEDAERLVRARPEMDFYVPRELGERLAASGEDTHRTWRVSNSRMFLLARTTGRRRVAPLPANW